METTVEQTPPSPWRTVWLAPRATIRRIVDAETPPNWWPVVALASFVNAIVSLGFDQDGAISASRSFVPVSLAILQTVGPVLIAPFIYAFVGERLGGNADASEIRQALAWSLVPFAVIGLCWIPLVVFYGNVADPTVEVPGPAALLLLLGFAGVVWGFVVQVIMLAEVQRFSIARAIANIAIIMVPLLLLGMVF